MLYHVVSNLNETWFWIHLNDCHSRAFALIMGHSAQAPFFGGVEFNFRTLGRDMKGHIIECFTAFQKDAGGHKANADQNLEWCRNKGVLQQSWFKRLLHYSSRYLERPLITVVMSDLPQERKTGPSLCCIPVCLRNDESLKLYCRELGIGLCRDFSKFLNPFSYQLMWSFYRSKLLLLPPIFRIHTHTCLYTPYILHKEDHDFWQKWCHPSQGLLFSPPGRKSCELIRIDVSADESLAVARGPTRWQPSDIVVKEHMASVC